MFPWRCYTRMVIHLEMLHQDGYSPGDVTPGSKTSWRCYSRMNVPLEMLHQDGYSPGDVTPGWLFTWRCYTRIEDLLEMLYQDECSPGDVIIQMQHLCGVASMIVSPEGALSSEGKARGRQRGGYKRGIQIMLATPQRCCICFIIPNNVIPRSLVISSSSTSLKRSAAWVLPLLLIKHS